MQTEVELYVAESDPQYGSSLPGKIQDAIDACDAILAVVTKDGSNSISVGEEIGWGKKAQKPIFAMVEEGANPGALLAGIEQLRFSVDKLAEAMGKVEQFVKTKAKKKADKKFWFWIGLAAIAIVGIVAYAAIKSKK